MDFAIKTVGAVLVVIGLLLLLRPALAKTLAKVFGHGNRLYLSGVVRLGLGILFLLAATKCRYPWIIGVFGVLFLLGAMVIFLAGPKRLKPMIVWFEGRTPVWGRIAGVVVIVLGAVIIYAA